MKKFILVSLLPLALGACAKDNASNEGTPVSSAAVHQRLTVPGDLQSLDGLWMRENKGETDFIKIVSSYVSTKDEFETKIYGLNLAEEIGYTFLATATDDALKLELNPDTNEFQALVLRTLRGGEQRVLKIVAALDLSGKESLRITITAGEKSFEQIYHRSADKYRDAKAFDKIQEARAKEVVREALNSEAAACSGLMNSRMSASYAISLAPRDTECAKRILEKQPTLINDPAVMEVAIEAENADLVEHLISQGADVNATGLREGGISFLKMIFENQFTARGISERGFVSTVSEKADIATMLVMAGAELNDLGQVKMIYLLGEAMFKVRDPELLNLMMDKGAILAPSASGARQNFDGFFYDYMTRWAHEGPALITRLIKEAGADPNYSYGSGPEGVLSLAFDYADTPALQALIDNGANVSRLKSIGPVVYANETRELQAKINDPTVPRYEKEMIRDEMKRLEENLAFVNGL